jgi:hypothetical protein
MVFLGFSTASSRLFPSACPQDIGREKFYDKLLEEKTSINIIIY